MVFQKSDKVFQVLDIECPVFESGEPAEILGFMIQNELVRRIIHPVHELFAFVDDGHPLTPGQYSRKQSGDLYVLTMSKKMWNGDGVIFDKPGSVIAIHPAIQKFLELKVCETKRLQAVLVT
jgi:hypothetical protein